jgi:hypothetical protein
MKRGYVWFVLAFVFLSCSAQNAQFVNENFAFAQTKVMLKVATDVSLYPRTTAKDGSLKLVVICFQKIVSLT